MASRETSARLPPGQDVTISVKLINPVNFGPADLSRFMAPAVPGLETFETSPSLSFLLEHAAGRKLVFDLGIRKDYRNYSPKIAEYIPTTNYDIQVSQDVAEILEAGGVRAEEIEAVIWRQANSSTSAVIRVGLTNPACRTVTGIGTT